jgi:hypothetical protein
LRIGREAWILGALLLLFVLFSAFYTERGIQEEEKGRPTTYSFGPNGLAALYRVLQKQGLATRQYRRELGSLPSDAALVVIAEPVARQVSMAESDAVRKWVEGGGALLFLVSDNAFSVGPSEEMLSSHMRIDLAQSRPLDLTVDPASSRYLRDIHSIHVDGTLRLSPRGGAKSLLRDDDGSYAVTWKKGKGTVIAAMSSLGADNAHLQRADNALLFVNIAETHTSGHRKAVLFDEYHQGYGEVVEGRSLWDALGTPARAVFWYFAGVFLILVYNLNRRFGPAKRLVLPSYRPSTEYIMSMARLFRKAGAGDIAIETIYKAFSRDLAQRLDAEPDSGPDQLTEIAHRRFGWETGPFRDLIARCEAIVNGRRINEAEMLRLAKQIEDYRRKADLVRLP